MVFLIGSLLMALQMGFFYIYLSNEGVGPLWCLVSVPLLIVFNILLVVSMLLLCMYIERYSLFMYTCIYFVFLLY